MEGFKEFTGKSLDDAIRDACNYYDASRERLEIDIVQDAKSGIFGLVGARKAVVRARRVQLRDAVEDILGRSKKVAEVDLKLDIPSADAEEKQNAATTASRSSKKAEKPKSKEGKASAQEPKPEVASAHTEVVETPVVHHEDKGQNPRRERQGKNRREREPGHKAEGARRERQGAKQERDGNRAERNGNRIERDAPRPDVDGNRVDYDGNRAERTHQRGEGRQTRLERQARQGRQHTERTDKPREQRRGPAHVQGKRPHAAAHAPTEHMETMPFGDAMEEVENVRSVPLEELDQERLHTVTLEAVGYLTRYIVGEVPMQMKVHEGRVHVHLECDENSGLLIGREGQTLAALQYISSRIVSRAMDAAVRVQLDAGDYRTRQDEKLTELASVLAERVRTTGKPHSTRPLSSYHRRIVHVFLQDATDLVTRSSGEGPLKRVIIQRKRG